MMTDIELLEMVGRALSAHDPRGALRAALDIRPDSVRQLLKGTGLRPRPGHFRDLLTAVEAQQEALEQVKLELVAYLEAHSGG
jgi:hypothetical protein